MVVVPAAIEGAALSVALAPFVLHRWDMYRWDRDHRRQHVPKGTNHKEHLTVLLPVWNEERIIEKKLDNLITQKFPMNLLLIDSASTDATVERVEAWLDAHPDAFLDVDLLRMDTRQGKTPAVVRALKHLGQHAEGLVCMTDACLLYTSPSPRDS